MKVIGFNQVKQPHFTSVEIELEISDAPRYGKALVPVHDLAEFDPEIRYLLNDESFYHISINEILQEFVTQNEDELKIVNWEE